MLRGRRLAAAGESEAIGGGKGVPGDPECGRGIAAVLLDAAARAAGRQDTRTGDAGRLERVLEIARGLAEERREPLGSMRTLPDQGTFATPLPTL